MEVGMHCGKRIYRAQLPGGDMLTGSEIVEKL